MIRDSLCSTLKSMKGVIKLHAQTSWCDRGDQNKDLLSTNCMSEMCPCSDTYCQNVSDLGWSYQSISPGLSLCLWIFCNKIRFLSEQLLAPRPNSKLEDHPLSAVCDCLFNIFAATLHIRGRSSIRNLRTRHAVVTGTHLPHGTNYSTKLKSP